MPVIERSSMKIVQLTAENVKRLKAVEITPEGAVQIVAGRNAQGKSSVLDAIWMALDWKNASKTTLRPVRDGEEKATVRLDLGDLVVTRKWSGDKTQLVVESGDGKMKPARPQELLDSLLGHLSFDPLAFTQQSDREQVQTLLGLVKLPFDPDELDAQRQEIYEDRRIVGQDLARAKGSFETMTRPAAGLPAEEVSTAAIIAGYEAAQTELSTRRNVQSSLDAALNEKANATHALREAQERLSAADKAHKEWADAFGALGVPPNSDRFKRSWRQPKRRTPPFVRRRSTVPRKS